MRLRLLSILFLLCAALSLSAGPNNGVRTIDGNLGAQVRESGRELIIEVPCQTGEPIRLTLSEASSAFVIDGERVTLREGDNVVVAKGNGMLIRVSESVHARITAISQAGSAAGPKTYKYMEGGKLVIVKDGVKYNALGTVIK